MSIEYLSFLFPFSSLLFITANWMGVLQVIDESCPRLEQFLFSETVIKEEGITFIGRSLANRLKEVYFHNFALETTDDAISELVSPIKLSFATCSKITGK